MSLFVRTEWRPSEGASLEARQEQAARVLAGPQLRAIGGARWYEEGSSLRDALSRPVDISLPSSAKPWEISRIGAARVLRLTVWNGRDDEHGVTAAVNLWDPPGQGTDTFVMSLVRPSLARGSGIEWRAILDLGRTLAAVLGGLTIVASGELAAFAEARQVPLPDAAVYAAFWNAVDAAGDVISAASWDEAVQPDEARVRDAARIVAGIRGC
jgi:hypothetical protein